MALAKKKEEKFLVPGWMVSFSDMIVNLMCFFILLNSYATRAESGFLGAGTGSYQDAINAEGKPGLMPAGRNLIPLEAKGGRHPAPKIDPLDKPNWTEHTKASIEDEFDRLAHSKSRVEDATRSFPIPLGITFTVGSAVMSDQERRDLDFLAPTIASRDEVLEVVGACAPGECADKRAALELSFARAQVVARRLQYDGVPAKRIVPIGVGASCPDAVADVRPKGNRRVALRWQLPTTQ